MAPSTSHSYRQAVQRVIAHLASHLDEAPDLGDLARIAGSSPFHFHRIFRGMVGETPLELLRRLRLERAAWRLRTSDHPVTRIAFEAGYEAHEAFTRAFRAAFGEPPSSFRTNRHARAMIAAPCGVHFHADGAVGAFIPSDTGGRTMQVDILELPARRLAAVRHTGAYNQVGKAFERLGAIAGPAGLFAHPGAAMFAAFHDDPEDTPVDALRSDACISIPDDVPLPAGTAELRLPAGRYARYTHIGPFEGLGDAWSRVMGEWLPASGQRAAEGPALEHYLSDMRTTPREELRTDLLVPLA